MKALRLLCVEDDPDIRHIVRLAVGLDPTMQLDAVESADAALALLASDPLPDAVLADVRMPDMDGPALLDLLRSQARTRGVPVIFVTAQTCPADLAGYRARGAIGVIVKPFDPMTLAERIGAMLASATCASGQRQMPGKR